LIVAALLALTPAASHAENPWIKPGADGYLAAYNLIYVLPLALIVIFFARTLCARKLTEREGRLLKLMSGVMMLELGALLLFAPEHVSQIGIAFGLMAVAVGITWLAARLAREKS